MAEVLHGNAGGNQLNAAENRTQVYGLQGNDTLTGDGKSDVLLVGGSGDDSLIMSGGNGTLAGGEGSDTFELTYSATKKLSATIEDFVPSEDKIVVNFDGNSMPQITTDTTSNGDVILRDTAGNLNVTISSVRDNDYFDGDASNNIWKVLELTNAEREADGKSPLTMADGLTAGAEIRVQEITSLGKEMDVYEHTRPEGKGDYSTVLEDKYNYPGENLDGGARSPAQVVQDWMKSDSHRENILYNDFQKLGVGYNEYDADPSNLRFYWVQLFADKLNAQQTVDVTSASPQVGTVSKFIQGDDEPNTISNSDYGVTISALGGGDQITNSGLIASISGAGGDDTINNSGSFATINGGAGSDQINLTDAQEVVIEYAAGDGSDTVSGLNATDTVTISGSEFTPEVIGNDIVVTVEADSITLRDAAVGGVQLLGSRSKFIILTDGDDSLENKIDGATIQAKSGNDTIENYADNVSIDGAAGNDTLVNIGENVTINGSGGNDYIQNIGENVSISSGDSNDNIHNVASKVTIETGDGNDSVANLASFVTIDGGEYNDLIDNFYGSNVSIAGGKGNDTISNSVSGSDVTITGGEGQDFIVNEGSAVTINAGTSNDRISLGASAQNNLIVYNAGDGNDSIAGLNETSTLRIGDGTGTYATQQSGDDLLVYVGNGTMSLRGAANLSLKIEGMQGELPDTTTAADRHITLSQGGDTYRNYRDDVTIEAVDGNDYYIVNEGAGVFVSGANGKDSIGNKGTTVVINGNGGNDFLSNEGTHVGVLGGAGNDYIENIGALTVIDAGNDDDEIANWSNYGKIGGGSGNDSIYNEGLNTTILGFAGNDTIRNSAENVTILGGENDDLVLNTANNVLIHAGTGDDIVSLSSGAQNALIFYNEGEGFDVVSGFNEDDTLSVLGDYVTQTSGNDVLVYVGAGGEGIILRGAASLSEVNIASREEGSAVEVPLDLYNTTSNTLITGTAYGDTVYNDGNNVTIQARGNNDKIENWSGSNVSIDGGAGNDSITNYNANVTINAGAGNDNISLTGNGANAFIQYTPGDGDDTIWGLTENSRLQIGDGTGTYSTVGTPSGDDIIIRVGTGSIRLVNFRDNPEHIIIGEQGTEGGGSGNTGGDSSSGSSSGTSGGRGGNDTGNNTSGGTSANEGMTSDASGGRTAVGSRGRSSSTSTDNGGNNVRVTTSSSSSRGGGSRIATGGSTVDLMSNWTTSTQQPTATTAQRVYSGGNQVVGDYQSGEKIVFGEVYTGSFYDGAGNFFVGSSTGALVIQNAADKVVDLSDAAGNSFIKAYSATTAGVIDGRGLTGFEIINGSAGSDAIFAGDGGSQLWGGLDVAADTMVGGGGADIFIGGRTQGADVILNASSADIVHLNDASLSDIMATEENNGAIAVAFNTGNVVAVQSTEALSAAFMLADGSAYRYNHAARTWQTA